MFCSHSTGNELKIAAPYGMTELVRGNDHCLVAQMEPLVRRQSVALDLSAVERIDAAGISALISLYGCAHDSGHKFRLYNVTPRVMEILSLVGLDIILLTCAPEDSGMSVRMTRSAA
jgi:anti-anti-sigma factor